MSGGFFRGTSADQDTRFSNKQAKLMKSQKFSPELEHLVDMTKVKMDVMRPWIANRVTELIGFEDEVLINFIYSLLDGKEVNGKEVQISLTGFMERNTGKFMKELWALLLSAQKNASGVPQQFLDAKEEETKKKKAESDRIANEIQRKKEKESRELEQERNKKMDAGNDISKGIDTGREPGSKHLPRASHDRSAEEKEPKERNGSRGRSMVSKSPYSADHSSSPRRTRSRSVSKSFSNSRSYSNERRRSRSLSASPKRRGRSSSSEMVRRSSPKRSLTPRRRHSPRHSLTPPRRRSSYSRRRMSPSPTRYRMRSPRRRRSRSPIGRRSRSPIRRWSRSPIRRTLPRNRSRSPVRPSSSFLRRRSPSLNRRRSPSPMWNRSPSPIRRRYRGSPLSPQLRSPSPVRRRSPLLRRRRSPSPAKRRSPSPQVWSSSSPVQRRSPLPIRRRSPKRQRSPVESPRRRKRDLEKDSPVLHASPRAGVRRRSKSFERRSQSDSWDRDDTRRKMKASSPLRCRSPPVSEDERKMSPNEDRRLSGPPRSPMNKSNVKITNSYSPSPPRKSRDYKPRHDSSERSTDDEDTNYLREDDKKRNYKFSRDISKTSDQHKDSHGNDGAGEVSPQRLGGHHPVQTQSCTGRMDSNKKAEVFQGGNRSGKMDHLKKSGHEESQIIGDGLLSWRERESPVGEGYIAVEKNQSPPNDIKINDQHLDALPKLSKKVEQKDRSSYEGSGSEGSDKNRSKVGEKRKNKRSERSESEDESSYDSYEEERKEAKRRRKEEKRSRKEEKRRRREEKRRKKEERRAEKLKLKSVDAVSSPSDAERDHDGHSDDDEHVRRQQSRRSNVEEAEPEQKKLEIELRERALENLRAKKGIGH